MTALRPLDEKRFGLLARMLGFHACVCLKKIQEPLVRRGYTKQVRPSTYEVTPEGRAFVLAEMDRLTKTGKTVKIETWPGIAIGNAVLIVSHKEGK